MSGISTMQCKNKAYFLTGPCQFFVSRLKELITSAKVGREKRFRCAHFRPIFRRWQKALCASASSSLSPDFGTLRGTRLSAKFSTVAKSRPMQIKFEFEHALSLNTSASFSWDSPSEMVTNSNSSGGRLETTYARWPVATSNSTMPKNWLISYTLTEFFSKG